MHMRYIHGAHVAPMWQLGTHWDTFSYMECMFPCWRTWKLLHGMACSHMETHVAHLHMMHVPTSEVCPHVPMLGLRVCSHMGSSHMTRVHVPKHGNTEFSQMWETHSKAFVIQVVPVVHMCTIFFANINCIEMWSHLKRVKSICK
jgi:hypothetical protein